MDFKLLIIKNKYTKKLNFKLGLEWFEKNTPIKIVTEEINTDLDFTFKQVGNDTFKGFVPKDYAKLTEVVPRGKYHAVVLMIGNEVPGVRVSICEHIPLYPETEFIYLAKDSDGGKTLNHELFHAFFKALSRKGVYLNDPMDTYLNDSNLNAKVSNRTMALELLKPHWEKLVKKDIEPTVTITRTKSNSKQVTGHLVATNGGAVYTCKTLELPWKNNAKDISCIPTGTYKVNYTFSPKFLKYTYEIKDVPNRSGIRIHSANYASQLNGCVALGTQLTDINKDGELDTTNSRIAIAAFEGFMLKKPFTLTII